MDFQSRLACLEMSSGSHVFSFQFRFFLRRGWLGLEWNVEWGIDLWKGKGKGKGLK